VLDDAAVDVVVITTRNREHGRQALAALDAGKHVFVEKPMALTEAECTALVDAVARTGRVLAVGFNRRFAESYQAVRAALKRRSGPAVLSGRINSPTIVSGYWMADPEEGGAVLGEGCHFADLFAWLIGAEPVEVSAWTLPPGQRSPIGEDNVVASFRFADGSIANLTYCTVGSRASAGERLEAFAPGIGASAEDFKRAVVSTGARKRISRWFPRKGYDHQMQAFLRAVRGEAAADLATVGDGARATIMCLGLLESARSGRPVSIDLLAR
jgi:predicted dehydrogenase